MDLNEIILHLEVTGAEQGVSLRRAHHTLNFYIVNIKENWEGLSMMNRSYKNEEEGNKPRFRLLT